MRQKTTVLADSRFPRSGICSVPIDMLARVYGAAAREHITEAALEGDLQRKAHHRQWEAAEHPRFGVDRGTPFRANARKFSRGCVSAAYSEPITPAPRIKILMRCYSKPEGSKNSSAYRQNSSGWTMTNSACAIFGMPWMRICGKYRLIKRMLPRRSFSSSSPYQ